MKKEHNDWKSFSQGHAAAAPVPLQAGVGEVRGTVRILQGDWFCSMKVIVVLPTFDRISLSVYVVPSIPSIFKNQNKRAVDLQKGAEKGLRSAKVLPLQEQDNRIEQNMYIYQS